jgi:hypothetical protein
MFPASVDRFQPALVVIEALARLGEARSEEDSDDPRMEADTGNSMSAAVDASDALDPIEGNVTAADLDDQPQLNSIVRAYLETFEPEEEQPEERFSLVL